jgi:hypothetical protein
MHMLIAGVFIIFAASHARAADKDEDKAKEVTLSFLKAVKAKDLDAVMKSVDAPFVIEFGSKSSKMFEKADELKMAMMKFLEMVTPEKVPTEVGTVYDMASLAKLAKEKGEDDLFATVEKLVGKTGFMVRMKTREGSEEGGMFVRMKDGKAFIAAIPK